MRSSNDSKRLIEKAYQDYLQKVREEEGPLSNVLSLIPKLEQKKKIESLPTDLSEPDHEEQK
jgi:hypothetical protein